MKKDYNKVKTSVMLEPEKEKNMQTQVSQVPQLPIPKNEKKRLMQAEVNLELFNAVDREMERQDLKIRQVMEWGLKSFLLATNPKEAARLGIKIEEKP